MMNAAIFLEKRNKAFWILAGLAFVLILGFIDYRTGYEISFSLFYLIPVLLVVWYAGGQWGVVLSSVSALTWFIADYSAGLAYSHPSIYVWNTLLRLGFYFVVTWLVSTLKKSYQVNQDLVRLDYVTGAISIRYFYELAKMEMDRSQRFKRPLTLAYIDLDNFKAINDRLGHSTGDKVLRTVTENIRKQVRPTDTLARLGGDEFGLLMPETNGEAAEKVVSRLHASLANEMSKNDWRVTFSVGVVTYKKIPASVDDMVKIADAEMYSVKTASKNAVKYCVHST